MKSLSPTANILLVAACLFFLSVPSEMLAGEMPLVYGMENTGADCAKPPLAEFSVLPSIPYLPDPFLKADGSRIMTRAEWRCRRSEFKAMLEHYDVGTKPGRPGTFKASLQDNTITITVGEG